MSHLIFGSFRYFPNLSSTTQSCLQIIRVLLAESMEMDPVKLFHEIFPKICQGHAESGSRRAGIVDRVVALSGALRVTQITNAVPVESVFSS